MLRLILASIFNIWFVPAVLANCEITPFPPVPPSPQEFSEPVLWYRDANGIRLSWQDVSGEDGYFVFVCNDARGFRPVATEFQGNALTLADFDSSGEHTIQIKAYVDVEGSFVFNTGTTVKVPVSPEDVESEDESGEQGEAESESADSDLNPTEPETPAEDSKASITASDTAPSSENDVVSVVATANTVQENYPELSGNRSFYSPRYPAVSNPMAPAVLEDGREIPALLTDAGITQALNRVDPSERTAQPEQEQPPPSESQVHKSQSEALDRVPVAQTSAQNGDSSERQNRSAKNGSPDLGQGVEDSSPPPSDTSENSLERSVQQGSSSVEEPTEPTPPTEEKSTGSVPVVVIIFAILLLLYFVFSKEEK